MRTTVRSFRTRRPVSLPCRSTMPTYDYRCRKCDHTWESFHSIKAEPEKKCPACGKKSAERLAYHILRLHETDAFALADAIRGLKQNLRYCETCYNLAEGPRCAICQDASRDQHVLCVVEQPRDLIALEETGAYRGLYHVLLGALSPLDGVGPSDIRAEELIDRVKLGGVQEVILATNPTIEGEATAIYLTNQLKRLGVRVSRIAYGIPVGMDIEYADEVTLLKSIEGRRDL